MKKPLLLLTATLLLAPPVFAQEKAPAPDNSRLDLIPSDSPRLPTAPLPLIPEPSKAPESTRQPQAEESEKSKRSKTEVAGDEMMERIKYRELKIKAEQEPAVLGEWDRAHLTKTDFERRAALASYYNLLYGRMLKLNSNPRVAKLITAEKTRLVNRLTQTRVAPTEPLQ